ncbi:MAG: hypothetical protein ACYTG7_04590 [Planctomycetota bacterium]|jgi:hypothetical protein
MRALLLFCIAFTIFLPIACTSLPRGTADEHRKLKDLCDDFLEHYCSGRFDEVEALLAPHALVAIDRVDKDEQVVLLAEEFIEKSRSSREKGIRFVERIKGEPIVIMDHKVATVWAFYNIEAASGDMEGFDVFQWIRLDEEWRLVSLSYTNRRVPRGQAR